MAESKNNNLPGMLVVLSGPTSVGKTTVGQKLLERHDDYTQSISATTRPPRGNESDGVDYHFYDTQRFNEEVAKGWFLEHAEVHGKFYGTPLKPAIEALKEGKVVLLIIDVDGAAQLRKLDLEAFSVFILPPSRDALVERMSQRGTEDAAKAKKRLERVEKELAAAPNYDVAIMNNILDDCVLSVEDAIERQRRRLAKREADGEKLYKGLDKLGL